MSKVGVPKDRVESLRRKRNEALAALRSEGEEAGRRWIAEDDEVDGEVLLRLAGLDPQRIDEMSVAKIADLLFTEDREDDFAWRSVGVDFPPHEETARGFLIGAKEVADSI